ncbi:hypothetical protein SGUI_1924 [Serinicoccus hydrothermalis]|uniref:DUF559 domain-containing protein n=1 Tax=Serinicoccus hydrothermalis TaxID=1758689 RepID=A0A1B1NCY0_9MICO|nr:hypothetical protein [Serinicoccus hydrothermalis]ANS79320.1 hypothetical protein SGUI_1924 [Serinicoccus hydrothermalis]
MPTRTERAALAQLEHHRRHRLARALAVPHDGVVTLRMLRRSGLSRGQILVEIERGAWRKLGVHTVQVDDLGPKAPWWCALWESGASAVLDGATSLEAAGLTGWTEPQLHVSVRNGGIVRDLEGVRHHRLRDIGPSVRQGLRRTRPEVAVVRAAQWATSDRAAATLVAMTVQQRLVGVEALLERWESVGYSARRQVLDEVIRDVCDGAHSLNELDFATACRERGIPEPTRQVLRTGPKGQVYLDVFWGEFGVHVEIHGTQHYQGTAVIDDALRVNDLGLRDRDLISLQIPVLGLRTQPEPFFRQIRQALDEGARRAGRAPRPPAA